IAGFSIVGIGVSLIFFFMSQLVGILMMVFALVAIVDPFAYAAAKRAYTVPRIGFVKFPQQRFHLAQFVLIGLFSLTAVLGGVAFVLSRGGTQTHWLLKQLFVVPEVAFAIAQNSMLVIGVSIAALFGLIGYTSRALRM
ncbi:MAG: hypothetical protein GTO63_11915, partial [Anaerolineae bacterium]|nr:hypothetical protein [Anaerolineae bacterium]NIN95593.1 hypothetical protein [Anaerolineae bacterium]